MSEPTLQQLITEAKACAGIRSCADGHRWVHIGGTNAGCHEACCCSVPVHECVVCGDCDYGETDEAAEIRRHCQEDQEP